MLKTKRDKNPMKKCGNEVQHGSAVPFRLIMSLNSHIEWTDATWNPVRGCTKISPGCKHCYAETFAERFRGVKNHPYEQGFDLRLVPEKLAEPFFWRSPKLVFVNSMSDLFQPGVPDDYIEAVCRVMTKANWHTFQVLTKRSERLKNLLNGRLRFAAKQEHIWWGTSVEDREYGLPRVADLQKTNADVRFLSIEPLLEDLGQFDLSGIHWAIVGGESGPGARPMLEDWVLSLRDQCHEWHVPFFFKQWGGVRKKQNGRLLEGDTYDEYPRRVTAPVPDKSSCLAQARDVMNSFRQIIPANSLLPATA
jgi:protein gp37